MLGLRQLGLGGWAPNEALAIEAELTAWQKAGGFGDRDNALRWECSVRLHAGARADAETWLCTVRLACNAASASCPPPPAAPSTSP